MNASIRDKEAWVTERAEVIAYEQFARDFHELSEETQGIVYKRAEQDHADTMADYAESRGKER